MSSSLKNRALRLLTSREHSRLELARKLAPHAESPDALESVLNAVTAAGWLSEARFVQSVAHRRAARYGTARIRLELQAHGVEASLLDKTLADLKSSELTRAHHLWLRRFGTLATTATERRRQDQFLRRRGFAPDIIRQVLQGRGGGDESDPG